MKMRGKHTETQGCITVTTLDCNDSRVCCISPKIDACIHTSTTIGNIDVNCIEFSSKIDSPCCNTYVKIDTCPKNSNIQISCSLVCTINDGLYILFASDAYLLTVDDQYLIPVKDG